MALRIDFVLAISIAGLLVMTSFIDLESISKKSFELTKELEFKDTTFTEVNSESLQNRSFSKHGIQSGDTLFADGLKYYTNSDGVLYADHSKSVGDMVYLQDNIVFEEKSGLRYKTNIANLNKVTEFLDVPAKFVAIKGENIFRGESMTYNMKNMELNANKVYVTMKRLSN